MKINNDIKSLLFSLCNHVGYDNVIEYRLVGKVIEGAFDSNHIKQNFRILLATVDPPYCVVMATVEYGQFERTYKFNNNEKWVTL